MQCVSATCPSTYVYTLYDSCKLQACANDLTDTVLDGCNATVLAYGQTGAGKTYTMTGGKAEYKQRGIIPRAIHQVIPFHGKFSADTCCQDILDVRTTQLQLIIAS